VADNTGGRIVMSPLEVGDVFGEMSVLTGDRTVADVIAGNRCLVLMIPQDLVSSHVLVNAKAILYLSKLLADRARAQAVDVTSSQLRARALAQSDDPYALSLKKEVHGKILSINAGLSQIRFGIYDTHDEALDVHGVVDCADCESVHITMTAAGKAVRRERPSFAIGEFFNVLFESMLELDNRFLFTPLDVIAVGHRVVHGGSKFSSATVITPQVLADIEALSVLAPLHNPHNLEGMREAMKFFPGVPHVAVFDTAFHQTLPTYAYLYGLPYEWYKKEGIRRYGFHGTSHRYVSLKAAEVVKRPLGELEIISCHLGVGASMCAIDHGRSVDTTMGMTPSDGLIMPSRSGSLDPAIMIQLMERYKLGPDELNKLINSESGLKGISGILQRHPRDRSRRRRRAPSRAAGAQGLLLPDPQEHRRLRRGDGRRQRAGLHRRHRRDQSGRAQPRLPGPGLHGHQARRGQEQQPGAVSDYAVISADDSPVTIIVVANNDERLLAWETLRAIERNQITLAIRDEAASPIPIEVSAHHVHLAQADVEKALSAPATS
jgi:acetate kinase